MTCSWWSAALLAGFGCNMASGLDDFGVAPESGAGAGGSGGAPLGGSGGTALEPCAAELSDEFDDGAIAAEWTLVSGTNYIVEGGGSLSFTVPAGVSDWWGLVTSSERYVLDGCGALVEHAGELPAGGAASFFLMDVAGNRIGFLRAAEELRCQYRLAGADSVNVQRIAYDPSAHRWLWVRPIGDTTEWYGSNDAKHWTLLAKGESVVDAASLELRLSAGVVLSAVSPGFSVQFDNVNATP